MNIGIIGSGGREHALCFKLKQSKKVQNLYCIPGNAGTSEICENVNIEFGDFEKTAPDSLIKGIVERQSEGISNYTELIKNLPNEAKNSGTKWLCEISNIVKEVLPVEIKE